MLFFLWYNPVTKERDIYMERGVVLKYGAHNWEDVAKVSLG